MVPTQSCYIQFHAVYGSLFPSNHPIKMSAEAERINKTLSECTFLLACQLLTLLFHVFVLASVGTGEHDLCLDRTRGEY